MMNIGVYYYPEAWPATQWERDHANIKKLGLEFVHMGEFAWAYMEPQENRFDFDWLEKNVELAHKQGLKIVLCTPSPAPPIWLVRKSPEVLMVDSKGRRQEHGSRQHACWSVPAYRAAVERIVDQLGKRFGNDPRVWGWQLDNELSHYGKQQCYCDYCRLKFQGWLKKKYTKIEDLNRDWGNAFWSQNYQSFDQIPLPNPEVLPQQVNPHAQLDFQRWFADEAADYLRFQTAVLRRYTKNQWITTNYMSMHKDVDPTRSVKDLDVMSWTHYPVHGNLNEGPLGYRMGSAYEMSFMHDFLRAMHGLQGLMELQPGQVNWGNVNPMPYPGAIRMWILRAFGAGAKFVCTYRYRQPLSGGELYHYGIVGPDGVTPTFGGKEYAQAMDDIRKVRPEFQAGARPPADYKARGAALLYNFDNRWDIDNHLQTERWNTDNHVLKHYKALKRLGAPVDVITEDKDFSGYPFLVAPAYQLMDRALIERLTAYAKGGGNLVLTCRTGQKDRRGHLWEAAWAEPIYSLIGASISGYDVLPAPVQGKVAADGKSYAWFAWGDQLVPQKGTAVLATYADQFYAGKVAAVTHKLGKGSVTYIGVESASGELEFDLMKKVYTAAGVKTQSFPQGVVVDWRDGLWVATNFSENKVAAPVAASAKMLVGTRELAPAGVAIWKE